MGFCRSIRPFRRLVDKRCHQPPRLLNLFGNKMMTHLIKQVIKFYVIWNSWMNFRNTAFPFSFLVISRNIQPLWVYLCWISLLFSRVRFISGKSWSCFFDWTKILPTQLVASSLLIQVTIFVIYLLFGKFEVDWRHLLELMCFCTLENYAFLVWIRCIRHRLVLTLLFGFL